MAAKLAALARAEPGACKLSGQETDGLRRIARCLPNPEIARELFITEATVKCHVTRIFAKLSVTDRTAAVTTAIARGILPPPQTEPRPRGL